MPVTSPVRRAAAVLEPLAAYVYFVPEAAEEFEAVGLDMLSGYAMARAAPLGRIGDGALTATFFGWEPAHLGKLVRWDEIEPAAALEVRDRIVRRAGERLLAGEEGAALPDLAAPIALLREATAACRPEGRALFAAHARLPWPDEPVAALWHGATLLREYRGDGHIAVLLTHGIDAVESLVLQAAYKNADPAFIHRTRGWSELDYRDATARLAARGFVDDGGALTDGGGKFREMVELETDHLAAPPFTALGEARAAELVELLTPLAQRVLERRGIPRSVSKLTSASSLA